MTELAAMVAAARAAANALPEPRPFTTWPQFQAAFAALDGPATALIREHLGAGIPFADEIDTVLPDGDVWVVDAVDGAVQYLQGLPQWAVSIALVRDGQPVLAALHSRTLGETYTAEVGWGAHRNGVRITPSAKADLAVALVATSQPPRPAARDAEAAGQALAALLPRVGAVRNLGPTSWQIADVASGRLDAFWEFGPDAANLLGASLIAREAGAVVTDMAGRPWHPGADSFLAAAPGLHAALVQ